MVRCAQGGQTLGGVPFTIATKLQLHGNQDAKDGRSYPERVTGIPVGRQIARLHLLHGANIHEPRSRPIAAVRLNYAGGSNFTFFISYGVHVRNWWKDKGSNDTVTDTNSSVVWTGHSVEADKTGATHRLYKTTFDLPAATAIVESIDLFSLFGTSSEVILAMTAEAPGTAVPKNPVAFGDLTAYRDSLTVKVVNEKGNPILGARVRGRATPPTTPTPNGVGFRGGTAITLGRMDDSGGEIGIVPVDFPADTTTLYLTAEAKEFVPVEITLKPGNDKRFSNVITAGLTRGIQIGGIVRDADGKPLPTAKVEIFRALPGEFNRSFHYDEITTDVQGRWRSHEVPESLEVLFRVTHKDFHRGEYEFDGAQSTSGLTRETLTRSQAEFRLGRIIDVTGSLRDEAGKPITNIYVTLMHTNSGGGSSGLSVYSDTKGNFRLKNVEHLPSLLMVRGNPPRLLENYAPVVLPIDPEVEHGPFKLVLTKGLPLRGRLVQRASTNASDQTPVPDATVRVTVLETPMIEWSGKPDNEGRFEWPHAPVGALRVNIYGSVGRSAFFTVNPGTREIEFDVSPTFIWKASAVDEATGEPIGNVTATPGVRAGPDGWLWLNDRGTRGTSGQFTFNDQSRPVVLKLEAPGYEPRAFPMPDRTATTNIFSLRRGATLQGTIELPDGRRAGGAQIAFIGDTHVRIGQGRFTNAGNPSAVIEADADGHFETLPRLPQRVLLLHPEGYLETTVSNLAGRTPMKLESLGTVEGVVLEGRKPIPDERVQLRGSFEGNWPVDYDAVFTARTDSAGRFQFTHVPPGRRWIARLIERQPGTFSASHDVLVDLAPGSVVHAEIGGMGRDVVGQVAVTNGMKVDWPRSTLYLQALVKTPSFRTGAEQRAWQESPEGLAFEGSRRRYALRTDADGRFRVTDVPPGRHRIQGQLYAVPAPGSPASFGPYLGSLTHDVQIGPLPNGRSDEPLDVGQVEFPPRR
jgi:protocatechuate 3,4-dioxygenase beta subunit